MAGDSLNIQVDASGNAVAELKRVQAALRANKAALAKLTDEGEKSAAVAGKQRNAMRRMGDSLDAAKGRIAKVAVATAALGMGAAKMFEMAKAGAAASDQFNALSDRIEGFSDVMARSQLATAGMVNRKDLMESAAAFDAFGLDIQQLDVALEQAAKTAIRTGQSAAHMASSLSVGVARLSGPILDNLGIQIKLSAVVERAAKELGKEAEALTDAEKKATLLTMALEQLSHANKDIDLNNTITAQLSRFEAKLSDTISKVSEWIALGWGDALGWDAAPLTALRKEIDGTADDLDRLSDAIRSPSAALRMLDWTGIDVGRQFLLAQSEAVKDLGESLRKLPQHMRVSVWRELQSTLKTVPPEIRKVVAEIAQLPLAIKQVDQDLSDLLSRATPAEEWWGKAVDWALAPTKGKKKKDPRVAARKAARAASERMLATAIQLREVALSTSREDEIRVKWGHALAASEQKIADLKTKGAKADVLAKLTAHERREINDRFAGQLNDLYQSQLGAHLASEDARSVALRQLNEVQVLNQMDLKLASARGPIERAQLQLERARIDAAIALRELSADENKALIERAEIQARLNLAQQEYNRTIRETEAANIADQLREVSAAANSVQSSLSEIGETSISAELGAITKAVGTSADAWAGYADGTQDVGQALAGTAGAVGTAAMAFIEDEREKAAIAAAMQAALAIAAYASYNIPAGIAHTAAAAAFTAIAAGAGSVGSGAPSGTGEGGGSLGSAGGSGASDDGGGDRNVVVQFHGGVLGNPQDVARAIERAQYSARRSGASPGW